MIEINLIIKKKNATINVASRAMHIFTGYNIFNFTNYINFLVRGVESASVALRVMHSPDARDLHRCPGSSPGRGAYKSLEFQ